ncbi:hypothetical protein GCM10010420_22980 [Streptomyces glaucosporus]|uniref:Transposase n=1 Tax=Streptomyces glaucosporus TaxID=284044 RepID=A0ABN3I7D0_9ACTN
MAVRCTREALADAVRASATLSEAITRLGATPTSGRRGHVRTLPERWGVDTSHFTPVRPRRPEGSLGNRLALGRPARAKALFAGHHAG